MGPHKRGQLNYGEIQIDFQEIGGEDVEVRREKISEAPSSMKRTEDHHKGDWLKRGRGVGWRKSANLEFFRRLMMQGGKEAGRK